MSSVVLDASAVLALVFREEGADRVATRVNGAWLSTVNLAEICTRAVDRGKPLSETLAELNRMPLRIASFDAEQAALSTSLRPATRDAGLSLGDRACLALAQSRQAIAITGDRVWLTLDLGIKIETIR